LKVMGRNTLYRTNVMVGEVWLASGQSNMEWPMSQTFNATEEIAKTANPDIRLFTVPKLKLKSPTNNVNGSWVASSPQTVPGFSAVAWYFARDLQKALNVPVGIIHTSWGGSPAEVWMSHSTLTSSASYQHDILDTFAAAEEKYGKDLEKYEHDQAEAKRLGQPFTGKRPNLGWRPSELYNGMIANLVPYAIKGAIWYQGESNAGRAHQYRDLFPDMISNWRHDWSKATFGGGNFTFLLVQLAPFMAIKEQPSESTWAELREAQLLTAQTLPKTGMAVITDVGDEKDIHPKKKEPVGARLALAARHIAYGEKVVYSGPIYSGLKISGSKAIVSFDHVGTGLEAREGELKGFAIAGADGKFVWGNATIQGKKVVVTSPDVPKPVAVRYGWADYPVVNLWNLEGLPATPFRTDHFPMLTEPKKDEKKK